jgi:RNA polymerase sigma-70 factor, ECF subfamily
MLKQAAIDGRNELKDNVRELRPPTHAGDRASLHAVVEDNYRKSRDDVYYYLLTLGLTPPQAQDAAQEVFLRLYVALRDGAAIENIRGWIFRVAHNHGIDIRRKEARTAAVEPDAERTVLPAEQGPEHQLLHRDRQRRLGEAFSRLSSQQRLCLHLRAEGLRYREIAEIAGISTSSVGEFLRRGIEKLRQVIHD